jgi:hypothetical protein
LRSRPDKRSHLDLQIDLLAEREMTAVLQIAAGHRSTLGTSKQH